MQDTSGYSALHHAALNGHHDIVELLLTHEASTNILDSKGSSPLHLAAWAGNIDIVRLLLCHGPSVPNVNLTVSTVRRKILFTVLHLGCPIPSHSNPKNERKQIVRKVERGCAMHDRTC